MHLLIADDNSVNCRVAQKLAKSLGHTTTCVENGQQALQMAASEHFDAILMDVQMPIMDGLEATRQILIQANGKKAPHIIAVTANAIRGDRETCLKAGMNDYLCKPLRLGSLEKALVGVPQTAHHTSKCETECEVDWDQFDAMVDPGDAEGVEIYEDFCLIGMELLQELIIAGDEADSDRVRSLAHQLKGSSSTFGFVAFSQQMRMIEETGEHPAFETLERAFASAKALVAEERILGG